MSAGLVRVSHFCTGAGLMVMVETVDAWRRWLEAGETFTVASARHCQGAVVLLLTAVRVTPVAVVEPDGMVTLVLSSVYLAVSVGKV